MHDSGPADAELAQVHSPVLLVTGADLADEALALLKDFRIVFAGKAPVAAHLLALCARHNPQAIIVRYGGISADMMDAAPSLRVIAKHGSGTDTIDTAAAQARGIVVRAAVGANAAAVAEHAAALMLACAKSVVHLDARMHAGHWDKASHKSMELGGRTVGLIGLGAIGQRVARICQSMDMQVIAHDPYASHAPAGVELLGLAHIWRRSDVISLHCPLTLTNRNLLNADTLAQCKSGVIVVNTARGGLIDEPALQDAVRCGQVRMAALDSFAVEPMATGHPFQTQAGFLLSPHIGGVTDDAYVNMGVAAAHHVVSCMSMKVPAVAQV